MASGNPIPTDPSSSSSAEDATAIAVNKRYQGLIMVRTKATRGKGAWYWSHFEPVLIRNPVTDLPKAVKLKCSLCDAIFSSSNPSRTASEHLKRGACPNFSYVSLPSSVVSPSPISSLTASPSPISSPSLHNHRKRGSQIGTHFPPTPPPSSQYYHVNPLAIVESTRINHELGYSPASNAVTNTGLTHPHPHSHTQHLVLSGGKKDLGALVMLEDSVKKLKSPKTSPGPALSKDRADYALELLADWFYESPGSISFSRLEHPKFKAFLNQVGLPVLSMKEFFGARLDSRFHEAKRESEARIREAMFFQVASDGWKCKSCCGSLSCGEENLVKFSVNLPNGTSLYQKAIPIGFSVSSKHVEELLEETVAGICGSSMERCVGIVADKYKAKALKNLEIKHHWMINLSCQLQGFVSLIEDFSKELPLFKTVNENCLKLAKFVNTNSQLRNNLLKSKIQELEQVELIRVPSDKCNCRKKFVHVYAMLEDIYSCCRALRMLVLDDSYKVICMEDPFAHEVDGLIQSEVFWHELEAIYSLGKLIRGMAQEIETERPLVGQCLPLWEELRVKVKDWCVRFNIPEELVEKMVEKRFRKNYHPAWSAAFILNPLYLTKDLSGKYLPPFKCLTNEQEKDVDKLITRLVSKEEAHVVLMELMKWRTEGLDPFYAQAVQVKHLDSLTGKMKIANPQSSRLVWETCLSEYKSLGKVAVRLIFLHATSSGFKCNWSFKKWMCVHKKSRIDCEKAQKITFVAAQAKLHRQDSWNEEGNDADLFSTTSGEDDMLSEVFADATSL